MKTITNFNWYKIAQEQQSFEFYNDPKYLKENKKDYTYYRNWAKKQGLTTDLLSELLETQEISNIYEIKMVLNQFGFDWEELKLKENVLITIKIGNNIYIIDNFDCPEIKNASEWICGIYDHHLYDYVDYPDFHKDFWDGVGKGFVLYHATSPENRDKILKHGLKPMNKTRGISNWGMPSAVFTSENPDAIQESYGPLVFQIDVGAMKQDGYMPNVSMESPFDDTKAREILAWKIGIHDIDFSSEYASEGLYEDTVAFYGAIPPKYLKVYGE